MLQVICTVMDISNYHYRLVPFFPFLNVQQLALPVEKSLHFSDLFCKKKASP